MVLGRINGFPHDGLKDDMGKIVGRHQVAVRGSAHQVVPADLAAGPRHILDCHRITEFVLPEFLQYPLLQIRCSTWGKNHQVRKRL